MLKCQGFRVNNTSDGQKDDQGGGPKMAKIQHGVKLDVTKEISNRQMRPMRLNGPWVNQSRGVTGSATDSP